MRSSLIHLKFLLVPLLFVLFDVPSIGQNVRTEVAGIPVNYDESKIPTYSLPDPLVMQNGKKVNNPKTWYKKRRPEILRLFENEQFGKFPDRKDVSFKVFETGTSVFSGKAIRRQVTIYFTKDTSNYKADLLIYLPAKMKGPVPIVVNISFAPNLSLIHI